MLALLLERTIAHRLKRPRLVDLKTAIVCFEELRGCHLNLVHADPAFAPAYVATEPTQEQKAILRSLRMNDLIRPEELSERIQLH